MTQAEFELMIRMISEYSPMQDEDLEDEEE